MMQLCQFGQNLATGSEDRVQTMVSDRYVTLLNDPEN